MKAPSGQIFKWAAVAKLDKQVLAAARSRLEQVLSRAGLASAPSASAPHQPSAGAGASEMSGLLAKQTEALQKLKAQTEAQTAAMWGSPGPAPQATPKGKKGKGYRGKGGQGKNQQQQDWTPGAKKPKYWGSPSWKQGGW